MGRCNSSIRINLNKYRTPDKNMKPTPREFKEAFERQEFITKYLIDEGYAENEESAKDVIMGMSEQWYETILKLNEKI